MGRELLHCSHSCHSHSCSLLLRIPNKTTKSRPDFYLHDLVHLDPDDVGRHEDEVHDQQHRYEQHVPQLVPQVRVVEEEGRVRGKFALEKEEDNSSI